MNKELCQSHTLFNKHKWELITRYGIYYCSLCGAFGEKNNKHRVECKITELDVYSKEPILKDRLRSGTITKIMNWNNLTVEFRSYLVYCETKEMNIRDRKSLQKWVKLSNECL